jgi:hypothetical protein
MLLNLCALTATNSSTLRDSAYEGSVAIRSLLRLVGVDGDVSPYVITRIALVAVFKHAAMILPWQSKFSRNNETRWFRPPSQLLQSR